MHKQPFLVLLFAVHCLALLAGCGPPLATVSGAVTVDGQPLEEGVVVFAPVDANGAAPARGTVKDGKYEVKTMPGHYKVQISASIVIEKRKASDNPDAPFIEIRDERLPARYHAETELAFEVKPGKNAKDWALESTAKKP